MGIAPQVVTFTQPQIADMLKRLSEFGEAAAAKAADAAVAKTRDSLSATFRSDQYREWSAKIDGITEKLVTIEKSMLSIFESVIESTGGKFVDELEEMLDKASKRMHQFGTDMQATLVMKIDEVKALIERLKGWRITLDEQSIAQLVTHARTHMHQAVAEAREHLAAYLTHDVEGRLDAAISAAVQKSAQEQGSGGFATFSRWCAIITCAIVASAAYLITKAVANFQPHQLNYKMLEDGKLVEASPEARAAVPRHEFVYN